LIFSSIFPSIIYSAAKEKTLMARRHQRGWLKKEKRSEGETWAVAKIEVQGERLPAAVLKMIER
jgi:ribosomal protein L25 (general stress protein Ctc)